MRPHFTHVHFWIGFPLWIVLPALLIFSVLCMGRTPEASAATLLLQPGPSTAVDTWIQRNASAANNGDSWTLALRGPTGVFDEKHVLLRFTLPDNSTAAILHLYSHNFGSVATVNLHKVIDPWDESTVTWNNQPNIEPTPFASFSHTGSGVWYAVDVTPALTASGTLDIELRISSSWADFYSSDHTQNTALRPKLEVTVPDTTGQLPLAVRDIDDNQPTAVLVALSFTAGPEDIVREILPSGSGIVDGSWQAWHALVATPPDPRLPVDSTDVVEVAPNFQYDPVSRMLTVTGGGFEGVTYQLNSPLPSPPVPGIQGEIVHDGILESVLEVPSLTSHLQGWVDDLNFWTAVADLINGSTENWANNASVAGLPVVTVDQDATLALANAAADGNGGVSFGCTRSGTNTNDIAAFLEIDSYPSGLVQGYAWVGTAFYVRGCNPSRSETASGSIEVEGLHWEGCLEWDILCAPIVIPPFIVCGGGASAARITWEVRSWPVVSGSISGSGRLEYTNDLRDTSSPPLPFHCPSESPPIISNHSTPTISIEEDRVYLARLLIKGRAAGYLGGAIVDFMDQADGGCWNQGSSRSGVFYNDLAVNFDLPPLPDLVVSAADLQISPNPAISGWPVDIWLTVHNYGTANAQNVEAQFLADAEPMCRDLINPLPTLPACPTIPLLGECGGQQQTHLTWCSTGVGRRGINARVDPLPPIGLIPEKDETNNLATDTLVVEPPPVAASVLDLDKSGSMDARVFPGGPRNLDVERWLGNTWVDLNSDSTALAVLNFGGNVVQELPLRYMTTANKSPAHSAVNTTNGVDRGATALFAALKTGLNALCCMHATPVKGLILYTDGGDNVSPNPQQDILDIIAKAICCRVPLVFFVVPPVGFSVTGMEPGTLPGGGSSQLAILERLARETGGGLYSLPVHADSAQVALIADDGFQSMKRMFGEGVIVSPVGQPGIGTGGLSMIRHSGSINVGIVGPGWSQPLMLEIITPPMVTFATLPTIEPSGVSLSAPPELLDGNTRLRIPLAPVIPDSCTLNLSIGGSEGLTLQIGAGYPQGDLDLLVTDGGAGMIQSAPITVARIGAEPTDIGEMDPLPKRNRLLQNYPNPFNPRTMLQLELREGGMTRLHIYNVKGELVRTLTHKNLLPGRYEIPWDGRDRLGREVSSGIYWARVVVNNFHDEVRITLIR